MKWWPTECEPGDMIRVKLGSVYHYGIFKSESEVIQFGMPPISEYTDDEKTVCVTDINLFSCGNIVEKAVFSFVEKRKKFTPEQVLENAEKRIGEGGYDIIHNNCEHFVFECVFGKKISFQVEEIRNKWRKRNDS